MLVMMEVGAGAGGASGGGAGGEIVTATGGVKGC